MSSQGSDNEGAVDSEEEDEQSSEEDEVEPTKLELPSRATRGLRMNKVCVHLLLTCCCSIARIRLTTLLQSVFDCYADCSCVQLLEEEDSADEEFWNQDFFAEAKADEEYQTESSEGTSADKDFSEPV